MLVGVIDDFEYVNRGGGGVVGGGEPEILSGCNEVLKNAEQLRFGGLLPADRLLQGIGDRVNVVLLKCCFPQVSQCFSKGHTDKDRRNAKKFSRRLDMPRHGL